MHVADTTSGRLDLIITLHPRFPVIPPSVQATIPVKHSWLSVSGLVTSHPSLYQWTPQSNMGTIINEIYRELKNAVLREAVTATVHSGITTTIDSRFVEDVSPHPESKEPTASQRFESSPARQSQQIQMPCIPTEFPQLESLSLSELEQLKSDPEALRDIVLKLTPVKAFRKAREEIIEANVKTANETLENEPLMKHLQEKNRLLRSEILCTEEELAGKHGRQREVYSRNKPDALSKSVSNAIRKKEMNSEQLADSFVDGHLPVHDFLSQYLLIRKEYHNVNLKYRLLR